jgi:ankyrin repeat protein
VLVYVFLFYDTLQGTPLKLACEAGHVEIVDTLLANEVMLPEPTLDPMNPFYVAAFNGHRDVIDVLLDKLQTCK